MKARDLMTSNPEFVTPDDSIDRAAQIMRDVDVGIVPVVDNASDRRLQGVITDRDIAIRHVAEGHHEQCRVADHMTRELDTVNPDADGHEVLRLMEREKIRRVPVVEEGNRLVGIIAQADILTKLGPQEPEQVEETIEKISEPGSQGR